MDTEIINRALVKLGEPLISSINQLPNGKAFELVYENWRKNLLSSYVWRFAVKKELLAPLDEQAATGRLYRFQLPSDCLIVIGIGEIYKFPDLRDYVMTSGERYVILGDKIECSINPLPLTYVADIDNTRVYSQWFKEALSAKIASEMTIKISQNPNLKEILEQDFATAITMAMQNNDIIQDTQSLGDNTWVTVREAWYGD